MAFDGNGTFNLPAPEYPAIEGEIIYAATFNTIMEEIRDALSLVLVKDGQAAMTGNLNLGGFSLTNGAIAAGVTGFTQPGTTNNTTLATTAMVQSVAMAAALPLQTGNAGKVPTTDGTTASWSALKTVGGNTLLGTGDIPVGPSTLGATVTDNYTIVSTTPTTWPIATTAIGKCLTAPDATTLSKGIFALLDNSAGTYPIGWRNSTGALVGKNCVAAGGIGQVYLEDNSTAAGVWRITGSGLEAGLITIGSTFSSTYGSTVYAPFVALDTNVSLHFAALSSGFAVFAVDNVTKAVGTPVTVTASASKIPLQAFAVSSTTAIVFYNDDANDTEAVIVSLSGATTLAVGTAQQLVANGSGSENGRDAPKIVQLTSTLYGLSGVTATGAGATYAAACSVSGTAITWGAVANIIAANNVASSTTSYALTSTTFFVGYKSGAAAPYANNGVVISVSGTTCTPGTPAALTNVASSLTGAPISCKLSATKILVGDDNNTAGSIIVSAFTISGATVTAGTLVSVETGVTSQIYTTDSATRNNPHLFPLTATTALLWYFATSVSRAVVLTESAGTVTAGTKSFMGISISATYAGSIIPQGTTEFLALRKGEAQSPDFNLLAHKIVGTTITGGNSTLVFGNANAASVDCYFTRLTSGDYVWSATANTQGLATLQVFRTNGDAISMRGQISCPAMAHDSQDLRFPLGVASNRLVILGSSRTGTAVSASVNQLCLINVEIAQ